MLTTLSIINSMLAATGTAPLTANDVNHPYYVKADNKLTEVNLEFQSMGHWFNRSLRTLQPNVDDQVVLPSSTLAVDPNVVSKKYVQRGSVLWDMTNNTDEIGEAVQVWITTFIDIPNMPYVAGNYLRAKAVYDFYLDEEGTAAKLAKYESKLASAWVNLKKEELKHADENWFGSVAYAQQSRRNYSGRRLPLRDEG